MGTRAATPSWVPAVAGGWFASRWSRLVWRLQLRLWPSQSFRLGLVSGLVLVWVWATLMAPAAFPLSGLCVVVVLAGYLLRLRQLAMLLFLVVASLAFVAPRRSDPLSPVTLAVVAAVAGLVVLFTRGRERLGVQGTMGESMLVDLRDRLRAQSRVAGLPPGWYLEHTIRSAYGDGFAGDFVLARRRGQHLLEVLLVDVSGKGTAAGTRALLLSGAYGGLVGALPSERLLPAANDYLVGQAWQEGFATAVQVSLDLRSGAFRVASAGHPPVLHLDAATGAWSTLDDEGGPALGILPDVEFPAMTGVLEPGDALMLYTDGVVEAPGMDLSTGIERLAARAGRLSSTVGLRGAARRLVDAVPAGEDDDRTLVVLWRDPVERVRPERPAPVGA